MADVWSEISLSCLAYLFSFFPSLKTHHFIENEASVFTAAVTIYITKHYWEMAICRAAFSCKMKRACNSHTEYNFSRPCNPMVVKHWIYCVLNESLYNHSASHRWNSLKRQTSSLCSSFPAHSVSGLAADLTMHLLARVELVWSQSTQTARSRHSAVSQLSFFRTAPPRA